MYPLIKTIFNDFTLPKKYKKTKLNLEEHINEINIWLDEKLRYSGQDVTNQTVSGQKFESKDGRLFESVNKGPVKFDIESRNMFIKVSCDQLALKSNSSFVTIKANCGVYSGLFMYETQIHSMGVMQIGWSSAQCQFNEELSGVGVGDTENSYGYDGSKRKFWHVQPIKYGSCNWRTGDILGICLDMNEGCLTYYRNGKCLGVASRNIPTGIDNVLYPAVSLAFNEEIRANFGGTPFRFPVAGFSPLQNPPLETIHKCEMLLVYLADLAHFLSKLSNRRKDVIKLNNGGAVSTESVLLIFGSIIVKRLSALLHDAYLIQSCVFPYLKQLCVIRSIQGRNPIQPGCDKSTLGNVLNLLWNHLEYHDVVHFFIELVDYMESVYNETSNDSELA